MATILNRILILAMFIFCGGPLWSQDPQFSQFYANPLYTNPALTGASNNIRIGAIGRTQYTGIPNNYLTAAASFDAPMPSLGGGLGAMFTSDVAGDGRLSTNTFNISYAYSQQLSRSFYVRAGIQAGYYQRAYDWSKFKFGDQIDIQLGTFRPQTQEQQPNDRVNLVNFAAGAIFYSDKFYGGFAVHNLTEPNQSFYSPNSSADEFKLPRRYTAHAGANIALTQSRFEEQKVIISPNVLYMQQRNYNQLNLGFYVKKQALTAGAWFRQTSRNSDAVILLVGLKFPKFRVGYSYDITVSDARTATQGSHELSMVFEIKPPAKSAKKVKKAMTCPEF